MIIVEGGTRWSMYKKALSITTFTLVLSFTSLMQAKNDYEDAFYAISSLQCYLDELIPDPSIAKDREIGAFDFDELDVANLWNRAFSYSRVTDQVQEAYNCYSEATDKTKDQAASIELYSKARDILSIVWSDLNPYLKKEVADEQVRGYPNFDRNRAITGEMRRRMRAYLLPLDSKLKPALDGIFHKSRAIQNPQSFTKAGFVTLFHQPRSLIRVAKHANLPGYLVKTYLDSDDINEMPGWERLTRRCEGAENIRCLIRRKNIKHFTVPDKWLYLPPTHNTRAEVKSPQLAILIVTNMNLVRSRQNLKAWKTEITEEHLDELYCIFSHGFGCPHLDVNVPYSKNGQFAFVDTEWPRMTIYFNIARRFLSPQMKAYWDSLVKKGGKC